MRAIKRLKKDLISSLVPQAVAVDDIEQVPCSSKTITRVNVLEETDETDEDEFVSEHEHDTSYVMGSEEEEEENDECVAVIKTPDFDMMFVSWEQIKPLFSYFIQSGSPANISKLYSIGATVFVTTECTAGHKNIWNSL